MRQHYNRLYHDPREASVFGPPEAELVKFLKETPLKIRSIADLCCGDGRHALYLAGQGHNVVAADYSFEAVRVVKERKQSETNLAVAVMDLTDGGLKPNSIGLAICVMAFHELDPAGVKHLVEQAQIATRPSGVNYHAFFTPRTGTYQRDECYYPTPKAIEQLYGDWKIIRTKNEMKIHSHVTPDSGTEEVSHMHNIFHLFAQKPPK